MERPYILHMLSPLKHVSPFDVNMALDAGFDTVVPYGAVELSDVPGLVQDAIFSRGPKGAKRTGLFIGGKDAGLALEMLAAAKGAMFPPFQISIFADPAGSFTTAAAMVACVERALDKHHGTGWKDREVIVFGATGVVGYAAGIIAAGQGARVTLVGYDGEARVKAASEDARTRFDARVDYADGSTDELKAALAGRAEVVLSAGRAGVQVLTEAHLSGASGLLVAADVNAVPPAGIAGLEVQADAEPLPGTRGPGPGSLGIGALTVGGVKYEVEAGLFRRMIESDEPQVLDFRDAFELARQLSG